MDTRSEILMEAGTNELEILVFQVNEEWYGINVAKVREVIRPPHLVSPPSRHPYVLGVFDLRGSVIPAVNVRLWLGAPEREAQESDRVIVTEFNQVWFGFWVDRVDRIHRVSWNNIEPPPEHSGESKYLTGVARINEQLVLMLDFEKVVFEISPSDKLTSPTIEGGVDLDRSGCKILIAEDSQVMRGLLTNTLQGAGYGELLCCNNGEEAVEYLQRAKEAVQPGGTLFDQVNVLITDIEMPQMDGLRLTKLVKSDPVLKVLPVIIFSSIISSENRNKGESVGADAQITKPEIAMLVGEIDRLILAQLAAEA